LPGPAHYVGHSVRIINDVVVGGGNAKLLTTLPKGVRLGLNVEAFVGGYRLWKPRA